MLMTRQSVSLVILLSVLLFGCGKNDEQSISEERVFRIKTEELKKEETFLDYVTSGWVEAVNRVDVRPEVQGVVVEVFAEEGQKVVKGQPLVRLDDSEYRKVYEETLWNLKRYEKELENLRQIFRRREELFRKELIGREEFEDVKTKLEAMELSVKSLTASLERAKLNLSKTVVRAGINGVVEKKFVSEGDYVGPQTVLFEIVNFDSLRFVAKIPQEVRKFLRESMPVRIKIEDRFTDGEISYISPSADRARLFTVMVDLKGGGFKPGSFGELFIPIKRILAYRVPEEAVQLSQRQTFVWVFRNSRAVKVPVRVIAHSDGEVLIDGPFKKGEKVITEGLMFLYEGAKVEE